MATTDPRQDRYGYGPAVVRLAGQIRIEIESGHYPHGSTLPSTKELAKAWSASNSTVMRAMDLLEDEGLVITKPRSGRFVNHPPERKVEQPVVLLVGGYAGSGKTQLGQIIARRTGWAMLDKDSTTRAVVEAALIALGGSPHDRESATYRTIIRPAEYQALMTGVLENVECGNSVVSTAPFVAEMADPQWCDQARANVEAKGGRLEIVWVRCDAETMRRYITYRGAARDAAKLADWPAYLDGIDLNYTPAFEGAQVIDNNGALLSLEQQAEQLLARIAA